MKDNPSKDAAFYLSRWQKRRNKLLDFQRRPDSDKVPCVKEKLTPVLLKRADRVEYSRNVARITEDAEDITSTLQEMLEYAQAIRTLVGSLHEEDSKYGEGTITRILKEKREAELSSFRERLAKEKAEKSIEAEWAFI